MPVERTSPPPRRATPRGGPAAREQAAREEHRVVIVRRLIILGIVVAATLLTVLVGVLGLSYTSAFTITNVEAEGGEHVSAESVGKLANVPEDATLLNLDEDEIAANIKKNPWVASVSFERKFPDGLVIRVREREIGSLVVMSSGGIVWYLDEDNVWIEPAPIDATGDEAIDEAALARARELGVMLITDVPSNLEPVAGAEADSEELEAVASYLEQLDDLDEQIVSFSVPSVDSLSCVLESGVVISLGAPTNIAAKESVVEGILEESGGKVTYINVRTPTSPSYRMVDSEYVEAGSGLSLETLAQDDSSSPDDSSSSG